MLKHCVHITAAIVRANVRIMFSRSSHLHGRLMILVLRLDADDAPRRLRQRVRIPFAWHCFMLLHQLLS